jgi:hypothetical protein
MRVVAVPDPALGRERVAHADVVLETLVGVKPEDLGVVRPVAPRGSGT